MAHSRVSSRATRSQPSNRGATRAAAGLALSLTFLSAFAQAQSVAASPRGRFVTCVENRATPEEVAAAHWLRVYTLASVRSETRMLVPIAPEARAAHVATLGRAISRLADDACRPETDALAVSAPSALPSMFLPVLAGRAAKDVATAGLDAFVQAERDVTAALLPATLARFERDATAAASPRGSSEPPAVAAIPPSTGALAAPPTDAATTDAVTARMDVRVAEFAGMPADAPSCPYPPVSRQLSEQGVVVLLLYIDRDGVADEVRVEESSGFERLDAMAVACVRGVRYSPKMIDGERVPGWQRLRWRWRLDD